MAMRHSSNRPDQVSLPQGWFCLSLDLTLAWGIHGDPKWQNYRRRLDHAEATIDRLCRALDAFQVSATWATIGAIMLPSVDHPLFSGHTPDALPEVMRGPKQHWFGPDLLARILMCAKEQDVGCHGFTHWHFDSGGTGGIERATWEVERCLSACMMHGIFPASFVFPSNIAGYHSLIQRAGFTCFRGSTVDVIESPSRRFAPTRMISRGLRFADQALGLTHEAVWPIRHESGLWNIPASAFLMPAAGLRGLGGSAARRRKLRAGIDQAANQKCLFHLWSDTHRFMADIDRMVGIFEETLQAADEAQTRGDIRIGNMAEIAAECEKTADRTSGEGA